MPAVWLTALLLLHHASSAGASCNVNITSVPANLPSYWSVPLVNELLAYHNTLRAQYAPRAVSMQPLLWSWDLASGAQTFLDLCGPFAHSSQSQYRRNRFGFLYIGENLAGGAEFPEGFQIGADMWAAEGDGYTYTTQTCASSAVCGTCASSDCGHFTQMIWANTSYLGCAYNYLCVNSSDPIYACWYGAGGNLQGFGPYVAGTPAAATSCPQPTTPGASTPVQAPTTTTGAPSPSSTQQGATTGAPSASSAGTTPVPGGTTTTSATSPTGSSLTTSAAPTATTTGGGNPPPSTPPASSVTTAGPGATTPPPVSVGPNSSTTAPGGTTATSQTTYSPGAAAPDSTDTRTGIVIGVVVAAVLLLVAAAIAVVIIYRKRQAAQRAEHDEMTDLHRMMR